MNNTVPQVEYIGGATPQESAVLLSARIKELRFNNPTFERDGTGFWLTYNIEIEETAPEIEVKAYTYPTCLDCPCFKEVSGRVKWGKCTKYRYASVNKNRRVCRTYWKIVAGGDELDA